MASTDWEAIREAFERGGMSIRKIADAHGVSDTAVRKKAKADSWVKPSKAKKTGSQGGSQQVRKTQTANQCEPLDIAPAMGASDDIQSAYGITPKAAQFVAEYMKDRNGTQAAIRAGYSKKTAYSQGGRLLKNVEVRKAIDEQVQAQMARTLITQDWVLGQWAAIATADPGEISQIRIGCCRHCHGVDHGYQYVDDAEYQQARYEAENKGYDLPPNGGYGYARHIAPAVDCPMCGGEGVRRQYLADTRSLSPQARLLFDGVEQTKDSIKAKVRSRDAALEKIAKHLRMFSDRDDDKEPAPINIQVVNPHASNGNSSNGED